MAFTVTDFADLMEILETHPEWRAQLRRQILDEEFLRLPEYVRALDTRLGRVEDSVDKLEASVDKLDTRLGRVEAGVDKLDTRLGRVEGSVDKLDTRLGRVEGSVDKLEGSVDKLEGSVDKLAEAQARTEYRVGRVEDGLEQLKQSHKGLATAIGQLQTAFGSTIEEEADSVLRWVLEQKGYRILSDSFSLPINGEADVVAEVESPSGERIWAVVEAKARLGYRQVRTWGQQMKSDSWLRRMVEAGVPGPFLVYVYGIRYDPGAVRAAEEQEIGLMSLKGERVKPSGLVYAPEFDLLT